MQEITFHTLQSKRLILRRFDDADLELLLSYRSDPKIAKYQLWEPFSKEDAVRFINEQKKTLFQPGQWFGIAIENKEKRLLIGDCAIKIIEKDHEQAEIGFNLSPEYQGNGFATEAVTCLVDFSFDKLGLQRISAITDCENKASIALLERIGMNREQHLLKSIWFKGHWGDEYIYGIHKNEWKKPQK